MASDIKTIALGLNIQAGSFGGGNQFATSLSQYLATQKNTVTDTLAGPLVDCILITSLKPWTRSAKISLRQARHYQIGHPQTKIILRVNECDERKGQRPWLNELIRRSMRQVDYTIFVSQWLRQHITQGAKDLLHYSCAIKNGVDENLFNQIKYKPWNGHAPLRLVTHHWSASWHKGWDLYSYLDSLLDGPLKNKVEFTFIGNYPQKVKSRNIKFIKPLSGHELATELQQHHVYITGSQFEPGPMHPLEAMRCGLPVLYRDSGSLREYVGDCGLGFTTLAEFVPTLEKMKRHYSALQQKTTDYIYTATDMAAQYAAIFNTNIPPVPRQRQLTTPLLATIFVRDWLAGWRQE